MCMSSLFVTLAALGKRVWKFRGRKHEMDEKYDRSEHYWKKGKLGMAYYTFLDANLIIDACDIPEEEKKKEKREDPRC